MKIKLAGYNVDSTIIEELVRKADWQEDNVTPETLSAAYARISRDPRNIDELRADSRLDVDKARKSNETIIFGYGHGSVAEHAVFNFDLIDISRLATETIQQHRLASYTEKSQRYIKMDGSFYTPPLKDEELEAEFISTVTKAFKVYELLYEKLTDKYSKTFDVKVAEQKAKEDARYILPLCTMGQFGMTVNARELERMIKTCAASSLTELSIISKVLYEEVYEYAPSLVKYVEPTLYDCGISVTKDLVHSLIKHDDIRAQTKDLCVKYEADTDTQLCAVIIYAYSDLDYNSCLVFASEMASDEKESLVKSVLEHKKSFETVKRYFEFVDFTFDITLSSSAYAQLKRHRLSSQIVQAYNPNYGCRVSANISMDAELNPLFFKQYEDMEALYYRLPYVYRDYILTSAHKRAVLLKMNGRELYQFSSLRASKEAQWDIRRIAETIVDEVTKIAPLTFMLLCGKDNYDEKYKELYG